MKTDLEKTINSGMAALQAEKYKEAQDLFQVALREAELGQDRLVLAACLDQMGETYFLQGQYAQAEPYYSRAYQIRRGVLTPGHEEIVGSLNNLSAVYFFQGKYELSKPLCEQLLAMYETILGKEHPEVATCLINLGLIALEGGRLGQAEKYFTQAHSIRLSSFGPQHVMAGNSLGHLGQTYLLQSRFDLASETLRAALVILEKHLGVEHPDLEKVVSSLIDSLEAQGKGAEAEQLCPRLVNLKEISLGPAHPKVIASLEKIAAFYMRQAKPEESAKLYQRLLAMKRRSYGDTHAEVARQMTNLATAQQAMKQSAQAEQLFLQALHIYEHNSRQSLGNVAAAHAQFLTALSNLATFYDTDGRFARAEKEWHRLIETAEKDPNKYGHILVDSYEKFANCLIEQNKKDDAKIILRKAIKLQKDIYLSDNSPGDNTYKHAKLMSKLADVLKASNQLSEAEMYYKEALDELIKTLGANHQDLAPTMEGYADLLARTYREAEAEHMLACVRNLGT